MQDTKERVAAAIVGARENLEQALVDLEKIPAFDPGAVAFAAHALGNYLSVISGTTDLLQMNLADHPDPQVQVLLGGVQHATSLMNEIAAELMKNASVTRAPKLRFEKVDLSLLVQKACTFYQRKADIKQIRILFESQTEQSFVWTDRVAVAAVLDNLLSNAVKYSPHEKLIFVAVREEPNHLVCSVQDEGPGLSADDQSKLYQKGVRLSPVPTGGEPSAGYGLAVAKELIDRLGGAIWCESEPGEGACFSIRVPKLQGGQENHPPPSAEGSAGATKTP